MRRSLSFLNSVMLLRSNHGLGGVQGGPAGERETDGARRGGGQGGGER